MKHRTLHESEATSTRQLPIRAVTLAVTLVAGIFFTGCAATSRQARAGKFYHVGLVWLKEPGNPEHRRKIIDAAHSFARAIPEVEFLSVGKAPPSASPYVDASFDVSLVMRLEDKAALDRYGKHPVHQKAAQEVFLPLSRKILFYDFIAE